MKLYWDTLRRPTQDKWSRWLLTLVIVAANIPNTVLMVVKMVEADPWAWFNAAAFLLFVGCMAFNLHIWAKKDLDNNRAKAPINNGVMQGFLTMPQGEDPGPLPATIPVTRPEDAADPASYAMMRALQDGESVSIYKDDDGVWRDSITDAVLPVQDPEVDDEPRR